MSTRRTYVAISGALAKIEPWLESPQTVKDACAYAIADALQELHPSGFDRARFLKDSGVES